MAVSGAQWYGFDVESDGVILPGEAVNEISEDTAPDTTREEMEVADVVTLLDDFYMARCIKPLAPPTCVMTKWGMEWIRRALFGDVRVEDFTIEAVRTLDTEANDPMDYVETHTYTNEHVIAVQGDTTRVEKIQRTKKVLKKGKRSNFAACIAHEAYNKFGQRAMTEANVLVTRRWLQKLLDGPEYKDLRMVDRNIAIDRALFLSFVPTNEFRKMKLAVASRAWQKRVDPKGLLGGLFGKAFMLIRDDVPDGVSLD
nr:hypothetical protein [Tolivirales sp.]